VSSRGKAYKKRKALRGLAEARGVTTHHRGTTQAITPAYDQLADPAYNVHVVGWRQAELETFELVDNAEEEGAGWLTLRKWESKLVLHYNHQTRRAWWEGFDAVTDFFIKDIDAYITQKFTP
jgi:hypothetical protein